MPNPVVYRPKYEIGQFLKIKKSEAILQYLVAHIPHCLANLCAKNVYLGLFFAAASFFAKYIDFYSSYSAKKIVTGKTITAVNRFYKVPAALYFIQCD